MHLALKVCISFQLNSFHLNWQNLSMDQVAPAAACPAKYDPTQVGYLREPCILVDDDDKILGPISKHDAHWKQGSLHRAFSVFLFNERDELLLQQRSSFKITFPLLKTNSCCSHPQYVPNEMDHPVQGTKVAAMRKLKHELGLDPSTVRASGL